MAEPGVHDRRDEGHRTGATLASSIESESVAEPRASKGRSLEVPRDGHPAEPLDQIARSSTTTAIEVHVIEGTRLPFRHTGTPPPFAATDRSELHPPRRAERVRTPGRAGGRARVADQPAPDLAEPAVAESPAIHVTIGRVEIRAAIPPAAQNKRPSVRSSLSLDEYLGKPARRDR
jgi:hypothetical protein